MNRWLGSLYLTLAAFAIVLPAMAYADGLRPARHDGSLRTAEYVQMGMPDPDKVWSDGEYTKAVEVLQKLEATAPEKLPRTGSLRSVTVFARMVAPQNFDVLFDRSTDVSIRITHQSRVWDFVKLCQVYSDADKRTAQYEKELVALSETMLDGDAKFPGLAQDLMKTVAPTDPQWPKAEALWKNFKAGVYQDVKSVVVFIGDVQHFDIASRSALATALQRNISHFGELFDAEKWRALKQQIQKVIDAEKSPIVKKKMETLLATINEQK